MKIVIPIFDQVELLDVTGPAEILGNMTPTPEIYLVAVGEKPTKRDQPVDTYPYNKITPFKLTPNTTLADCPKADILLVPGGPGQNAMMQNVPFLEFLRHQAKSPPGKDPTKTGEVQSEQTTNWVTSVCTGALLLGAAGLLDGYMATTHWDSLSALNLFPKVMVASGYPRYVICGNRITSGGVSSGLDMTLALVAVLQGEAQAKAVQMYTQYAPDPPFNSGSPATAGPQAMATAALGVDHLRAVRALLVGEDVAIGLGDG
jgi:cyclohexyl-isocyanide hydratase